MSSFQLNWKIPRGIRSREAAIKWVGEEYFEVVYYGATLRNGTVIPGRRWVDDPRHGALSRIDLEAAFADNYRQTRNFQSAFSITANQLADACYEAIVDDRWPWPRVTERESGQVAGRTRNIFDSGRLASAMRGPYIQ